MTEREKKGVPLLSARGEVIGRVTEFEIGGVKQPLTGHFEIVPHELTDEEIEQHKQELIAALRKLAEGPIITTFSIRTT